MRLSLIGSFELVAFCIAPTTVAEWHGSEDLRDSRLGLVNLKIEQRIRLCFGSELFWKSGSIHWSLQRCIENSEDFRHLRRAFRLRDENGRDTNQPLCFAPIECRRMHSRWRSQLPIA